MPFSTGGLRVLSIQSTQVRVSDLVYSDPFWIPLLPALQDGSAPSCFLKIVFALVCSQYPTKIIVHARVPEQVRQLTVLQFRPAGLAQAASLQKPRNASCR